jgi:hypothetical protein
MAAIMTAAAPRPLPGLCRTRAREAGCVAPGPARSPDHRGAYSDLP